ncbi:TPA: hypothetical protein RJX18_001049 [Legionella pneumophila]|uniref:membrane protein n=1 Tax=Legionella pneumophila TaxID=446 RepID=UPI0001E3C233|nr:membrane protein [Legionella pneumophila]MDC8030023.1 Membrane protein [Legionella pneumophila subsp. pneumophila]MDW8869593.1 hypothetical protein [Legionella pneumophila]MDW8915792.1 hypothetical protein [Legionella pneumophila]MDW8925082.1 hypothetical protein [Legionella pneumophila]MDW8930778.1 hypothetical protein [Legionella pneumophila]
MIRQIKTKVMTYWEEWIAKRISKTNPQILDSQNIYIMPSGFGWAYSVVVLSLFSGAINYQVSTVFLMSFILAIVGFISAWEAHANLKGLSIKLVSVEDTYEGTPAQVSLLIQSNNRIHFGLDFHLNNQSVTRLEKIPPQGLRFILPLATTRRGCYTLPKITISSFFPFGLFQVWGYANFDSNYYVYPQPVNPGFWPTPFYHQNKKKTDSQGDNEYYDLKQVENPWIQPNLIAWKIAAKGQGWYLKTMDRAEEMYWLFRLNDLPIETLEEKLKHMSYWLVTAESQGQFYKLELGNDPDQFSHGEEHLRYCLRQLAVY